MKDNSNEILEADSRFFSLLIGANTKELDRFLSDDFMLIDVMQGSEIPKTALLEAVGSRQLIFESIEPADRRARTYHGTAAVVTGRTQIKGRFAETAFAIASRYTHVYIQHAGQWRLTAAQGTPIAAAK